MTSLPVFERLEIDHYAMFPGEHARNSLAIPFGGLSLVLGANGLGKTTLVHLLYRMCAGPWDLRASTSGDFGGGRLEEIPNTGIRRMFALRVVDEARDATATLTFRLGEHRITTVRLLSNLSLNKIVYDDTAMLADEDTWKSTVTEAAGVYSYADWLILLRYLVFYFEDRRALVWDQYAQRQLIRILFFPPARAKEWVTREGAIQRLDSNMRNLQNIVTRNTRVLAQHEVTTQAAPKTRAALSVESKRLETDEERLVAAEQLLLELDAERQTARLRALTAERDHESTFRDLEQLQYQAIAAAFPSRSDTAHYILGQLLSDGECLVCGQDAQRTAATLRRRIAASRCVLCGRSISPANSPSFLTRKIERARGKLEVAAQFMLSSQEDRERVEARYEEALTELAELHATVTGRRQRVDELARQLPPDDAAIHEKRQALTSWRADIEAQKRQLDSMRAAFSEFLQVARDEMETRVASVKDAFERFAEGFLFESVDLVWSPRLDTVGQSGPGVEYPGFELDMGSASFPSPVRRSSSAQVSESQREFIDLAFRMALMTVGTPESRGSLVIDAPESSLDAVFARRAATVLARFAKHDGNVLTITSNLNDGDLIPALLRSSRIVSQRSRHIVDLLRVAAPTSAIRALFDEYEAAMARTFTP